MSSSHLQTFQRAPLRLYYTVYERLSAPKVPTAVCEKQASIVSKGITSGSASKQDSTEETHGVKRKQDDGPDDVSFDQSAVTPEKTEETIKTETCNPKKKNKKQVDSTVLEAVSKSEEILAKLTLDCSNDANGLMRNEDQRPEALAVNDVANKEQNKDSSKSEDLSTCTPIKTSALNQDDSPVLSLFEPLNAEPSGTNVYDFNTQEPSSSSSGETDKPKGKRGRKKKRVTERDKNEDDSSVSNKVSENETNLVISNKHPGIKAATPKKERKKLATVSDHIEAKDGKVKAKKTKKDSGHAKGKAKTVKEILEKAQNKTNEEKVPKKRGRPQGSVNKVKKVKVDGNSKIQQNEPESDVKSQENAKQGGVDDVQSAVSLKPVSVKSETGVNNKIDPAVVTADKTTTDSSLNETVPKIYNNIEHPVTPPYGQTPKPAELNPGLPVSVTNGSVNMGQNGALNNGIFVPSMNGIGVINGHDFRPIINGYIPPVDNSDQPLDLTNNAQRSEYMKGKIFKTKMLKKTPTKSDGFTGSGDRANAVNDWFPGNMDSRDTDKVDMWTLFRDNFHIPPWKHACMFSRAILVNTNKMFLWRTEENYPFIIMRLRYPPQLYPPQLFLLGILKDIYQYAFTQPSILATTRRGFLLLHWRAKETQHLHMTA